MLMAIIFLYLALSSNLFYVGLIDCKQMGLHKVIYVSKARGQANSDSCGSESMPCKSLQVGVDKLAWGGRLFVDGEHTAVDPYKCESSAEKLVSTKSIFIQSYTTTAHISCIKGFFVTADGPNADKNVTITGVQLSNTLLFLKDISAVIRDCIFTASAPAITVNILNGASSSYSLDIQNAVFTENLGCIQVGVKKGRTCNSIIMNLRDTIFQNNTTPVKSGMDASGLISVNCSFAREMLFFSSWKNVKILKNRNNKEIRKNDRDFKNKELSGNGTSNVFVVDGCDGNLTFSEVASMNNQNSLRFLEAKSDSISISIQNSSYHEHHINEPGGVMRVKKNSCTKGDVIVSITDSIFHNNSGSLGGILQVDGKKEQSVKLNMNNVTLLQCYGSVNGCAVSVGTVKRIFALFDGLEVEECHDPSQLCMKQRCKRFPAFCLQASETAKITIKNSRFTRNKDQALLIQHTSGGQYNENILDVQISNSSFIKNSFSAGTKPTVELCVSLPDEMQKSILNISKSLFLRNTGVTIMTHKLVEVYVRNSTCEATMGVCLFIQCSTKIMMNSTLYIENCRFNENKYNVHFKNAKPSFIEISIKNTTFHKNHYQTYGIVIQVGRSGMKNTLESGRLLMDHVYFTSNYVSRAHGNILGVVSTPSKRNFTIVVRNSVFKNNRHIFRQNNTAFINLFYFYIPPALPDIEDINMKASPSPNESCPKYHYRSTIIFDNVTFLNNTAVTSTLFVNSGIVSFHNCLFEENFSSQPEIGGHVYVEKGATTARFYHTRFIQTKKNPRRLKSLVPLSPLLFVGAQGPLIMKNTSFKFDLYTPVTVPMFDLLRGHDVDMDNETTFVCPVGSYLKLFNATFVLRPDLNEANCKLTIIQLRFSCQRCPFNKYTLMSGSYRGKQKKNDVKCLDCPFGAQCTTSNIQSRPNFWGYKTQENPPQLKFEKCPEGYCEQPERSYNLSTYNKCAGHRGGTMCGACKTGYTENMFNHKCCPVHKCRDYWFWVVAAVHSVIIAIFVLCQPSLILFLTKKALWFREKKHTIPNTRVDHMEKTSNHDGHAYFKIIFYFYQVAELLMLESYSEIVPKLSLLSSITSFFNFEVVVSNSSFGCPFPGLTAVTKELFRCSQVFAVMVIVVLLYFLHWLFSLIWKSPSPHFAHYLAAIVEVLILGYERLGHTSFKLLNCVPLDMLGKIEWRLVIDGNITCWVHWWQYVIIAYNIVFVLPFLLVLFVGTSKLKRHQISALQFVAACFVPLPFLMYWLLRRCLRCDKDVLEDPNHLDQERQNDLLEVLQGPFRPPDNQSKGALYWESILIGRRLVLLCLFSFIAMLLPRLLCMTLLCMLILIHNVIVMPYKDRKANIFAIVLLSIHVVMATINLGESVLITAGVTFQSPLQTQIDGFKILEIVLLSALPCAFALLVVAVVLSQTVRLLLIVSRYCLKDSDITSRHASYQPLLNSSEETRTHSY
ncbi:uncharacterized protein LOC116288446 [Actinia tenebrosa]|uniref:Uncharacterized protein LOC116288446 n=1 Tax=Actinia tenebrosa TaxID=6105 RepID=A0A6P8HEU0_ACTTE|nr:uncharacterized protein LOC116288446 [Actinia tenebrosa]